MVGEVVQIDDGVPEWEDGLPSFDDIPPLTQCLIPPRLAVAFKISPETSRTLIDVNRASECTMSSLRSGPNFKTLNSIAEDQAMVEPDDGGSDSKRRSRIDEDSGIENSTEDQSNKSSKKRARLVWTPQLHKRFVEVVAHLELKNAVPKTIMSLMNVEGLTRENVASHLQKYRLYVKRMQGLSNEGPSPSDHLFASTPLPRPTFHESAVSAGGGNRSDSHTNNVGGSANGSHGSVQIPMMPYPPPPQIMPMPVMGMTAGSANSSRGYNGYEAMNAHHHYHHHHHHYQQQYNNAIQQQQRDWSGNKFNGTYSHGVMQNNK